MLTDKWVPVYKNTYDEVLLLRAFLESDEIETKIVPDVTSPPLRNPGAHNVKSEYSLQLLLVAPEDEERAKEMIEVYQSQDWSKE